MPESFHEEVLREAVCPHLGSPADLSFERITTGKFNTSYYVKADACRYVLRIAPEPGTPCLFYERDMMRQEPSIHALLLEKTTVPVAKIYAFDTSHAAIHRDFLLMDRLPGTAACDLSLSAAAVQGLYRQVGAALSEIHGLHADAFGYLGEHHPMEPQRDWVGAFVVMWNRLLDDIQSTAVYSADEIARMRALLREHLGAFDHAPPACLLHMDIWAQNILCDRSGGLTGLVDFDRALWGDPEIEFAVLDYCGVSVPGFWEGYGRDRDTSLNAVVRQRFYYLYELQKYVAIEALRRGNPTAADAYRRAALEITAELDP